MTHDEMVDRASKAVEAIVDNLSDRRGLGQEWDGIDDDIRNEIKAEWTGLIVKELMS